MEKTFVDQLNPLLRHRWLEAVLCFRQDRFLKRTMRGEQGDQSRRFINDAALEPDRRVASVDTAADAVGCEESIEFGE